MQKFNRLSDWSFKHNSAYMPSLKSDFHLPHKILFVCFHESPLKMMKNAFYLMLEAIFVLKIFKFFSWLFWSIILQKFKGLSDRSFKQNSAHRPSLKSDFQLPNKILFICFHESPLKMMKNAFYLMLEALFVLKIFNFFSWLFGH